MRMKFDTQETLVIQSYAAFMIASSYFASYVCATPQKERRACLLYRIAGNEMQYKMEDRMISFMEKNVIPHLDADFLSSKVEICFLPEGKGIRISDGMKTLIIEMSVIISKKDRKAVQIGASLLPVR